MVEAFSPDKICNFVNNTRHILKTKEGFYKFLGAPHSETSSYHCFQNPLLLLITAATLVLPNNAEARGLHGPGPTSGPEDSGLIAQIMFGIGQRSYYENKMLYRAFPGNSSKRKKIVTTTDKA